MLKYHQNGLLSCFCFRYQTPTISVLKPKCSQDCKVSPRFTQVRFCCRLVRVRNLGWFAKKDHSNIFLLSFSTCLHFFSAKDTCDPLFSLKMIEAEGSQTFHWSPTKASKKNSKQPGRNCHSQQQLKPIYESKFSSETSTLSDNYRGPTLSRGRSGSAEKKWRHAPTVRTVQDQKTLLYHITAPPTKKLTRLVKRLTSSWATQVLSRFHLNLWEQMSWCYPSWNLNKVPPFWSWKHGWKPMWWFW